MKGITGWSYQPYTEASHPDRADRPYVCRIAPKERGFTVDFLDRCPGKNYTLTYWLRFTDQYFRVALEEGQRTVHLSGLMDHKDYVFKISRDGVDSDERLVRTGFIPGVIINYLHPEDPQFHFSGRALCSPSLLRLPDGTLLASMDVFEGQAPQNLTLIYASRDDGKTWEYRTDLFPCFWGRLFLADGKLYMLGCSTEYGDLLIGRSDDGGFTWGTPTVLFRGANHYGYCGWHRAPMPVRKVGDRYWTDVQYGGWGQKIFGDAALSVPVGSDLLNPENWTCSDFFYPEQNEQTKTDGPIGGIEGNIIEDKDGNLYDFLRWRDRKMLLLKLDPENPERVPEFSAFVSMPATASKFDIQYDPVSGMYVSIVSYAMERIQTRRNVLSLIYSPDLMNWYLGRHLLDYCLEDPRQVGFQYVTFLLEEDRIIYQCRTAFNGAANYHDANAATFHEIPDSRQYLKPAAEKTGGEEV